MERYDVAVIGAGIVGCSVARELSKYQLRSVVIEKENDVSLGATRANSAIVHAGYDPVPGTMIAKYNVEGSRIIQRLAQELDFPYKQIGAFVLAFDKEDEKTVENLYQRGVANGVPALEILSPQRLLEMEPNLNPEIRCALYAPTTAICSPWEMTIAQMDNAVTNGVELLLKNQVIGIEKLSDGFRIITNRQTLESRFLINAAGVYADEICAMVEKPSFHMVADNGDYYILDKSQGNVVSHVVFQCPSKMGKGVLLSPTVHGNLIVGPDAQDIDDKEDRSTTAERLQYVLDTARRSCNAFDSREAIRNFAGVRPNSDQKDFVIYASKENPGYINLGGMKSPGLTSGPAIAVDVLEMLREGGLKLEPKAEYTPYRKVVRFKDLSKEEKQELIARDSRYGRIICRCETVTEGEIVAALHGPFIPASIDGIKRRCGAGMGRCQGGFCRPRVQAIIARELGIPFEAVEQDREGSYIVIGKTAKGDSSHDSL